MTRQLIRHLVTVLLVLTSSICLAAENLSVEETANGWINWDRQVVKAVGHGILPGDADNEAQAALLARAAAITDAYRNLASVINGVRVTGETYVKNYVTQSDEVRLNVEGFIRGAQIVSEKQLPNRSYEIIMQAPLSGKFSLMSQLAPEILPDDSPSPVKGDGDYTGLIIDARGLDVKPSMSPKVYDESGREVYGTVQVSADYAIEIGIAVYPRTMEQALKSPRAGDHPLVVKALKTGPRFATNVTVCNADADRIRKADRESGFLSRCCVSVLLGPCTTR